MLRLYLKTGCPFCQKVLDYASEHNIPLQEKNIYDEEQNLKELLQIGGKQQVPFLLDQSADISLYESDDIVKYLEEHIEGENIPPQRPSACSPRFS